jgi:RNA recognition motif-containing protein
MMTTSNTTASVVASPGDQQQFIKNDNSNPQQGTEVPPPNTIMDHQQQTSLKPPIKNSNSGGRPTNNSSMRSPPTKKDSRKLFVGGLPADITEDEFRVFFEQFGEVVDSVVMFDRETRRSRGFGFVTFQAPEVAETLLNMKESVEGEGEVLSAEANANGPRIGRLVMRGKTCEVKAAEPKESTRPNRRGFQNQPGGANRRFVDKAYPQGGLHPPSVPHHHHPGVYHDPHYMAGHHYPMVSPPYYPAYHPGMYHGGAGYHTAAPMYAPVAHAAPPVHANEGLHQAYAAQGMVDGAAIPYMEGAHEAGHAYVPYGPPQVLAYPAGYVAPTPAAPSSAMHPAAPGLPTKDD